MSTMLSTLECLLRKMFGPVPRRKPPQRPRFVKPRLEALEERLVLDAYTFVGAAGGGDGTSWNDSLNWIDSTTGGAGMPGAGDDASIGAGFGVVISGTAADVNSLTTAAGSSLTIVSGDQLTINSNAPGTSSDTLSGSVIDAGLINANTTDPLNGTNIIFAGGSLIGPGDLNGNIAVGPNSSMTFLGGGDTFASGATFGMGAGSVNIAATVTVMGDLDDNTNTNLNIVAGGDLTGPGSLDDWANVNWTGGTISLTGGVTVYTTFTSSGSSGLTLTTTLANDETTDLGGTGGILLGTGGEIDNVAGTLTLSQTVFITLGATGDSVTNSALGILDIPASLDTPVTINASFTNLGTLNVGAGSELDLTSMPADGSPTIDLDGNLGLDGNLYLEAATTSSVGFTLLNHSGFLEVGDSLNGITASLTVPTGVSDIIQGNLEITDGSLLNGGGTVYNSGRLQLDVGSSTMGLGAYVQSNYGTLAIEVDSFGDFTPLTVTGTAQLSGTLVLPGYDNPQVGDYFTVVTAASLSG
ncbi:MAG TPA: hypothetical protein VMF69_18645, partial [Gemmataceae bacterium]|nr:hypothetical protein [Gemmataceae bacterium]